MAMAPPTNAMTRIAKSFTVLMNRFTSSDRTCPHRSAGERRCDERGVFVDPDRPGSTRTGASPIIAADERPLLVDEWQRVHPTWDVVRRLVDEMVAGGFPTMRS